MNCRTIALLTVLAVLPLGCQTHSRQPTEEEIDREISRFQEILKPQLDQIQALAEQYRDQGIAEVQISPLPAVLYVDDGEYVEQAIVADERFDVFMCDGFVFIGIN